MKKIRIMLLTALIFLISLTACGVLSEKHPEERADVPIMEEDDTESIAKPDVASDSEDASYPENASDTKNASETADLSNIEDTAGSDMDKRVTYEVKARVHMDRPDYRFVATGLTRGTDQWLTGFVLGLQVYDENQALILSEDFSVKEQDTITGYPVYNEMMDTMGLHVTDVNFDGYKDVIILNNFAGAHGNTWYDCWLWDEQTASFVASPSFAAICNPALDRENQCIFSSGGSGAAYWGGRIYQFVDGAFVLTNELDTAWGELVEKKLVNGTMEIVRQVQYGDDEKKLIQEQEYYKNDPLWLLSHPRWYWVGGHEADSWLE